jgi:ABC-type uncharacterized transport system substrate-binding protein
VTYWTRLAWLIAMSLVVGAASAQAYPHAFVVYSVVLPLTPQRLDRIGFVFTFDPLFSVIILRGLGPDDPASRSRSEIG